MKPVDIQVLNKRLLVDDIIIQMRTASGRATCLLPKYQTGRAPFVLVRHAMEKAWACALYGDAAAHREGWISQWGDCDRLAHNAAKAIQQLVKRLPKNMFGVEDRHQLVNPLRLTLRAAMPTLTHEERNKIAVDQAAALVAARDLLNQIASNTSQYRKSLTNGRSNPGDLAKMEFAIVMAEWWRDVTGQLPGSGSEPTNSPFLRFVSTAWQDIFEEEDVSFVRPVRRALVALKGDGTAKKNR